VVAQFRVPVQDGRPERAPVQVVICVGSDSLIGKDSLIHASFIALSHARLNSQFSFFVKIGTPPPPPPPKSVPSHRATRVAENALCDAILVEKNAQSSLD